MSTEYNTDPSNPPRPPKALGDKGKRFWRDVVKRYSLRVDELVLLEQACRSIDDIERLGAELSGASLVVKGSMGQNVAHPLLAEVRGLRTTLAAHLRQLGLPDVDEVAGQPVQQQKSARHQRAAQARWARRDGARSAAHARAEQGAH